MDTLSGLGIDLKGLLPIIVGVVVGLLILKATKSMLKMILIAALVVAALYFIPSFL